MSINFLTAIPWKMLVKVELPFWRSESRATGFILLETILGLMAGNSGMNVFLGWATGQFMTALSRRSLIEFWRFLGIWILAILIAIPVQTLYGSFRSRLALAWRRPPSLALYHERILDLHSDGTWDLRDANENLPVEVRAGRPLPEWCEYQDHLDGHE